MLLSPRAGSLSPLGALSAILTLAYPFLIAQFTNYLRVPVPHLGSWRSFPWVPVFLASVPPWKISSISATLYNKISTNKNPSVKKYTYIYYTYLHNYMNHIVFLMMISAIKKKKENGKSVRYIKVQTSNSSQTSLKKEF